MRLSLVRAIAAALFAVIPMAAAPGKAPNHVVFAVVVTRHGVRSITSTPPQYSWADWQPVAPGYLTARGYQLMTYMGKFYRVYFGSAGIPVSCRTPNIYLYADKDQRTLETGHALIEGLCGKPTASPMYHAADLHPSGDDPLFNAAAWAASQHRIDAAASRAAVEAALPKPPSAIVTEHASQFAQLQRILDTRCSGACVPAVDGSSVLKDKDGLSELAGPVNTASTYAEDLFLEYAQCRPNVTSDLSDVMMLHVLAYDFNERIQYNARVRGGTLFAHIVGMMEAKAGLAHADVEFPDITNDKVVIFSGHDTQLSLLGGILEAHWTPGEFAEDDMPPSSALIFELYKYANEYRVRARFAYETMDQFHHYKLLDGGVASVPVKIRGCEGADCSVPLSRLSALAHSIAESGLVRKEWTAESADAVQLDPLLNPKWTQCDR